MNFLHGLVRQGEVVHAVILRETRTRFGAYSMGYLWALLEPALFIITFYVLFAVAEREAPYGMTLFGFLATGVVPYLLFSSSVARVAESINGNTALLFYPHVFPIDLVIARSLLEVATFGGVFLVLMTGAALNGMPIAIDEPLLVVAGFFIASMLGSSLGLIFCMLGLLSKSVERARGPLMRPFFWTSGIFFVADALPEIAKSVFFFNPVLHAVELVRAGWYQTYDSRFATPGYALAVALGLAAIGLTLERVVRRKIEVG